MAFPWHTNPPFPVHRTGIGHRDWVAGLVLLFLTCMLSLAHEGPEVMVKKITRQIEEEGASPALLLRRANEYRVLGNLREAEQDLRKALDMDPDSVEAMTDLGRVYVGIGKNHEARRLFDEALDKEINPRAQSRLLMRRSEILEMQGQYPLAMKDCQLAMTLSEPGVEDYLTRSRLQRRLGLKKEACQGLKTAHRVNGSHVLHEEWVEALIDAGFYRKALKEIEPALTQSRWRSSWLLRRGRTRLGMGDQKRGEADLRVAVAEINRRLHPDNPDLLLLLDRAMSYALLGKDELAEEDRNKAMAAGALPWMMERLDTQLADR